METIQVFLWVLASFGFASFAWTFGLLVYKTIKVFIDWKKNKNGK